jgi:hypothetical protein
MPAARFWLCLGVCAVGLAGAAPASATELLPAADTYVDAGKPRRPAGAARLLRVSKAPLRRAFMRFDLGSVEGSLERATLHLRLSRGRVAIRALAAGARWSERRTTYARAPRATGPVIRSRRLRHRGWAHVDITRLVTPGGSLDLALAGAPRATVASRESAFAPRLTVIAPAPVFIPGPIATPGPASASTPPPPPDPATVTVIQDSDPDDGRPLSYSGTLGEFTLTGDARESFTVGPGRFGAVAIAQSPVIGWSSGTPSCIGDPGAVTSPRTAILQVDPGERVECVFAVVGPAPIAGVYPETSNHIGPFVDGNGNLYTVTEIANVPPRPAIRKSTDGGRTWSEVDGAHRPSVEDLESVSLVQDGTRIHMLHQRSGYRVYYNSFNTSDAPAGPDAWVVRNEELFAGSATPRDQSVSLALRRNGDLVAFYVIGDTQIAYRKRPAGGTWGPEAILDTAPPGRMLTQVFAEAGTIDDTIHIAYKQHATTSGQASSILYRSLSPGDVLSPPLAVASNAISGSSAYKAMPNRGLAVLGADGGDRVHVAWRRLDERLVGAEITVTGGAGTVGPEQAISDGATYQNPLNVLSNQVVAALAPDIAAGTLHALYADKATHDLWSDARAATWGADRELLDDADVMAVSANVFTHSAAHGGGKVLGMVLDQDTGIAEQGAVHYAELELPAAP